MVAALKLTITMVATASSAGLATRLRF